MIKLLKVDNMFIDGQKVQRFQSQLYVGKDTVDFIMRDDNTMLCYGMGENGFDFYEYKKPYKIVGNVSDMIKQPL